MNSSNTKGGLGDEIVFTAVGDIMLGDHPVRIGHGVRSLIELNGTRHIFSRIKKVWERSDIVFGNLEVIHSDVGLERKIIESFEFRGCPESVAVLKEVGFNIFNIANNHCLEHGLDAFWDSIHRLKKNDIFPLGLKNQKGKSAPFFFRKGEHSLCMIGYSMRPEKYHEGKDVPYALTNTDDILTDILQYRNECNSLIVSLHWGEEFMSYPSPKQVLFARECVNAGADVIVGHHAHVLQGFETFKSGLILYNLGNFVFDMWQAVTRKTVLINIRLSKGARPVLEILPLFVNKYYQPCFVGDKFLKECYKYIGDLNSLIENIYPTVDSLADKFKEEKYLRKARIKDLLHRFGNYFYFFLNLHKYDRNYLFQSFRRFVLRKIIENK